MVPARGGEMDLHEEVKEYERLSAERDKWPGKLATMALDLAPALVAEIRRLEKEVETFRTLLSEEEESRQYWEREARSINMRGGLQ